MQVGSSMLEPTARSNQATDIGGRGIAFETSDLTDEDAKVLKQEGLVPVEKNEDGYTVFIYDDNSHSAAHEAKNDAEDELDDEEEDEDEEEEEPSPSFKGRTPNVPTAGWHESLVAGSSMLLGGESIHFRLTVMTACDTSDPSRVKHLMKLDTLRLLLPNCVNTDKHRGHFVYRIVVDVMPTEEWRTKINRMLALPSDDSTPKEYTIERTRTSGVAINITGQGPELQGSWNKGYGISSTTRLHEWAGAKFDDFFDQPSWSVNWTWNVLRWEDGQLFNPNEPWKVKGRFLPKIPYRVPALQLTELQDNWAEWSTSLEKGMEKMDWNIRVQFCTVSLEKQSFKLSTGGCKWIKFGPEVIMPIKAKITGAAPRKTRRASFRP